MRPDGLRASFEPRFDRDFGDVRLHEDAAAARAVRARAYTVGSDIVFDTGEYAPGTPEGRRLLAHELTHLVQQSVDGRPDVRREAFGKGEACRTVSADSPGSATEPASRVTAPGNPLEQKAETMAGHVLHMAAPPPVAPGIAPVRERLAGRAVCRAAPR